MVLYSGGKHCKFPKLNCKIVGLRNLNGMDGVDFMLNKANAILDYLKDKDSLEALWYDGISISPKVSFI